MVKDVAEGASPFLDFANNLRRMTGEKGTIAQVCRDLGMNRQQFNKYLSGTTLPSPQSLQKLADYFGVDQRAMFYPGEGSHPLSGLEQFDSRAVKILLDTLAGSAKTHFREGCYVIYYPWLRGSSDIVRAIMVVFKVGNLTCFRRYTKLAIDRQVRDRSTHSRHEGIVIESAGRSFLLARNMQGAREISLQSFGSSTTVSNDIVSGLAVLFSAWQEPFATRVTIDYFGPSSALRSAMKLCGVVPGTAPNVSEAIRRSVLEPVSFPTAQLFPFQVFDRIRP